MADLSHVEDAIVALAAAALYPSGTGSPSAIGATCRIGRGWPQPGALNADLAAGVVNVSVAPRPGMTRNTTRYQDRWLYTPPGAPTLTATVSGATVTFAGTPAAGQLAGIASGSAQGAYLVQAGDTLAAVAAALAALVPGCTAAGPVVTAPSPLALVGRVVSTTPAALEVRRQTQGFQATVWAPTPALRDAAAGAIDAALSYARWLALPDGSKAGPLIYTGSVTHDTGARELLYRRDLLFQAEYPTTMAQALAEMLFGNVGVTKNPTR